jgi:hypothetical protein
MNVWEGKIFALTFSDLLVKKKIENYLFVEKIILLTFKL